MTFTVAVAACRCRQEIVCAYHVLKAAIMKQAYCLISGCCVSGSKVLQVLFCYIMQLKNNSNYQRYIKT